MKRLVLLGVLLILSIATLLFVANFQKDTNTISINEPNVIKASVIMIIIFFLPPILLSFFNNRFSRMFSFYYQIIFLLGFLALVPIGLFSFRGIPITILASCGAIVSLWSLLITKPNQK
ncbi:hypothetical protein LQF61_05250 [Tetragenococcus koreensis]|uniref:hypothetical protein n=1 Tax=Tetragenococcus koreensis TaxID=290335 RepID=UPI000F4DC997|nr:hypothetical protein [Tetragenococcus koreensis]AYW45283.1 hypothetical protein C7K43_04620 [Tetragenococcus koreensis]MCF1619490.1 hypothetical protein [Tetragenococcus koreensis]MCF1656972.1 hypothetical protein [Tetragenococcus koreensis]GEN90290.1 hypothetical protein TKO01_03360 [Tetragenococcus koreensis]